jgi:DNA polymerase
MDARRAAILEVIGIDRFVSRATTADAPAAEAPVAAAHEAPSGEVGLLDWEALEARVSACTRCDLATTRQNTVFGTGDRRSRWFIVGEAPGADEDRQGEPFVGRAGQLLNAILRSAGFDRGEVYIANVLKCRPPGNRDPSPAEAACCLPYLHRQIALVAPDLVLCVGRIAAQNLLGVDTPLGQLRGKVHRLAPAGVPVVVTYHPAYLLRTPSEKRKVWADLRLAMETARGQRP